MLDQICEIHYYLRLLFREKQMGLFSKDGMKIADKKDSASYPNKQRRRRFEHPHSYNSKTRLHTQRRYR